MLTLSCFTDEAGEQNMDAGYYMATLVFHDQSKRFERFIDSYVALFQARRFTRHSFSQC